MNTAEYCSIPVKREWLGPREGVLGALNISNTPGVRPNEPRPTDYLSYSPKNDIYRLGLFT